MVKMPLLGGEIRGIENLTELSKYMLTPYESSKGGHLVFDLEEK